MNTAEKVATKIEELKKTGNPLQWVAWQIALLCVGWAYVFGARGEYCTPANRRKYYASKGDAHPTIKTACKGFDSGSCSGCKWYPSGKTRFFDCRGFTYWILLQVFGWKLVGVGATSQWDTESNWKAKGTIDTMPKDTLVCLFYRKKDDKSKMAHTGFGYNGETVECSAGVQHKKSIDKKWEYWAVPACIDGDVKPSDPTPKPETKPTLKKGSKGSYVTALQTELMNKGYSLPKYGADGSFGNETLAAVKAFQKDAGLKADGIVVAATWAALEDNTPIVKYTVTIPHLSKSQADTLVSQYPGSTITEERG